MEILSPGISSRDLVYKRHIYHRFHVPEYWILDPDRERMQILTWSEKSYEEAVVDSTAIVESPLLSGLKLDLSKVFR